MKCLKPLLATLLAALPLQAAEPPVDAIELEFFNGHELHSATLPNGLRVIAIPDNAERAMSFLVYGVGGNRETPETTGLAHLAEHMLFSGTEEVPLGAFEKKHKDWGGSANASTREDYTLYYSTGIPPEELRGVLEMEADRMRNLTLHKDDFEFERERLRKEEAGTYDARAALSERVEAAVLGEHPYAAGVYEGRHTKAPGLEPRHVRAFLDKYYHPRNAALVVVSPLPPEEVLKAAAETLGKLDAGPEVPPPPQVPELGGGASVLQTGLSRDGFAKLFAVPPPDHADYPALAVLAEVMGQRALRGEQPYRVEMGERVLGDLLKVSASGPEAREAVEAALRGIQNNPPTPEELAEAKENLARRFERLELHTRPYFSIASELARWAAVGMPELPLEYGGRVRAVTSGDVERVAFTYLAPQKAATVRLKGAGPESRELPEDTRELSNFAQEAAAAGDLELAIAAYTRLYERSESAMWKVIHLATRAQLHMENRQFDSAVADIEAALEISDYPALRPMLEEARKLQKEAAQGLDISQPALRNEPGQ